HRGRRRADGRQARARVVAPEGGDCLSRGPMRRSSGLLSIVLAGSRSVPVALAVLVLVAADPAAAQHYRIDTFAGRGTTSPAPGLRLLATDALLRRPSGCARNARGDVFIAAHDDARVLRVRTTRAGRTIIPVAGSGVPGWAGDGGPALDAQLVLPTGLSLFPG